MICTICMGYFSIPVVAECGHIFCYNCIIGWAHIRTNNGECPICRRFLAQRPVYSFPVEYMVHQFVQLQTENCKKEYFLKADNDKDSFLALTDPFKDWTIFGTLIRDESDGVLRCGSCMGELEFAYCSQCLLHFIGYSSKGISLQETSSSDQLPYESDLSEFVVDDDEELSYESD